MFDLYTDSCCDLPIEAVEEGNIKLITNWVSIDSKEYEDDLGATFSMERFYRSIAENKKIHTSQINYYTFYQNFLPSVKAGQPILYLAFSKELGGGSWGNAQQAKATLLQEFPDAIIYIVDSLSASLGQGLLVLKALQYQKKGASVAETAEHLEDDKKYMQHYLTVKDLMHLQRGGRLSMSSAAIGSLIHVNPILYLNSEGKLESKKNLRGRRKALTFLVEKAVEENGARFDSPIGIVHADSLNDAKWLKQEISNKLPETDIMLKDIGPTIGTHLGLGGLAVVYFGNAKRAD